jgi:hypothetical protein
MNDLCPIKPRGLQRQLERFRDVPGLHRCTELPGDDVAREVVQYRAEVKPAPADDLEIVKSVCQSWFGAIVLSLNSSAAFHHDEGRAGDQVVRLQQAIDRSL